MLKKTSNFACIGIAVKSIERVSNLLKHGSHTTKERFILEQELRFYIIKLTRLHVELIGALNSSVVDLPGYVKHCQPIIGLIAGGLPENRYNDYLNKYEVVNTWNQFNPSESIGNTHDPLFTCAKSVSKEKFRALASGMALIKKIGVMIRKDKKRMLASA